MDPYLVISLVKETKLLSLEGQPNEGLKDLFSIRFNLRWRSHETIILSIISHVAEFVGVTNLGTQSPITPIRARSGGGI